MRRRLPDNLQRLYEALGDRSNAAEPETGAQEFLRIDRFAVHARFVMQVRAGRAAGRADLADDLADTHRLSDSHVDLRQMAITGREPVAVVDLDHIAVAAVAAGD